MMDCCDLCGRLPSPGSSFDCATCVRSALYPLRLEHATTLLGKEAMGRKVEAVVQGGSRTLRENISLSGAIIDTAECGKAYEVERMHSEATALSDRIDIITEKVEAFRKEMEATRREIAARRAENAKRKDDAESATFGLKKRSEQELEASQSSIRRTNRRWELHKQATIYARIDLCRAAARVAGLKRERRIAGGKKVEFFRIAENLPIYDLRELHTAQPDVLTASLTQIAYLTHRVAAYLGLKLPAEITLPHKDYPLPTIFHPESSYLAREADDVKFPGLSPGHSSNNSPTTSRILDNRTAPRPRPLYVYKELSKMLKEEPVAVSMFIEGVTLLAWDVAWLCRIHGMNGLTSWKDLCSVGSNLWQLLVAVPTDPGAQSTDGSERRSKTTRKSVPELLGHLSHATAHSFFGVEHVEMMEEWKLRPADLMKIVYRIKRHLVGAIKGPEWEVIDEREWDVGRNEEDIAIEEPVMVGGRKWKLENNNRGNNKGPPPISRAPSGSSLGGGHTTAPQSNTSEASAPRALLAYGRKGSLASAASAADKGDIWMKVRSRNNSTAQ